MSNGRGTPEILIETDEVRPRQPLEEDREYLFDGDLNAKYTKLKRQGKLQWLKPTRDRARVRIRRKG